MRSLDHTSAMGQLFAFSAPRPPRARVRALRFEVAASAADFSRAACEKGGRVAAVGCSSAGASSGFDYSVCGRLAEVVAV
jgi:hypothetical protein